MEQKHKRNNIINCLEKIINKTENWLKTTNNYYNNFIFSSKQIEDEKITTYLNNININQKLTSEEANLCKNYLSENECFNFINKHMKANKSLWIL